MIESVHVNSFFAWGHHRNISSLQSTQLHQVIQRRIAQENKRFSEEGIPGLIFFEHEIGLPEINHVLIHWTIYPPWYMIFFWNDVKKITMTMDDFFIFSPWLNEHFVKSLCFFPSNGTENILQNPWCFFWGSSWCLGWDLQAGHRTCQSNLLSRGAWILDTTGVSRAHRRREVIGEYRIIHGKYYLMFWYVLHFFNPWKFCGEEPQFDGLTDVIFSTSK